MKMNFKLSILELSIITIIGIVTVILQPPIPLLSIPFLIIIALRTIFLLLGEKYSIV